MCYNKDNEKEGAELAEMKIVPSYSMNYYWLKKRA
jgi:hypothetical protein